jgi:hypothetical protein
MVRYCPYLDIFMYKFLAIIFYLGLLTTCQPNINSSDVDHTFRNSSTKWKLELYDSIVFTGIKFKHLMVVDHLDDKYLGYDIYKNQLIEFTDKGEVLTNIEFHADNPYYSSSTKFGFTYLNEDQILMADNYGLSLFDIKTARIESIYSANLLSTSFERKLGLFTHARDTFILVASTSDRDPAELEFRNNYDSKRPTSRLNDRNQVFILNYRTKKEIYACPIPLASRYRSQDTFYLYNHISWAISQNTLSLINKKESTIWQYTFDGESFELITSIPFLTASAGTMYGIPYAKSIDILEYEKTNLANVVFNKIYHHQDTFLISYRNKYSNAIVQNIHSIDQISKLLKGHQLNNLILVIDHVTMGNDLPMPPYGEEIVYVKSLNEIFISKNIDMEDQSIELIYKCRLRIE